MTVSNVSLPTRTLSRARAWDRTAVVLALLVAASAIVRALAGALVVTPTYFPDEYVYAELARSLAETGRPLIEGAAASFPALLQPLLTAPAWLVQDVESAYRLVQLLGAVSMSLAAIPAFLLAREVGLERVTALAVAALAVAVPDLVYAASVLSEPFAYPLALGATWAAVASLARPAPRVQLVFLAFAAVTTFARLQFAVLPLCFLAAAAIVGLRERRLRAALREQALPLGAFACAIVALAAVGLDRALGYYRGIETFELEPIALARWAALDLLVLLYTSGWIVVPGAVLGLALALARPRSRSEVAFGAFAPCLVALLTLEAALVAANGTPRALERYVFYGAPLIAVAFALYAARGWPHRLVHALGASALVAVSAAVPLAGFAAADGKIDSPFLSAVFQLERLVGDVSLGALAVAGAAALLAGAAVLASLHPRVGTNAVLALALVACAATSALAVAYAAERSARVRSALVGARPSWIDESGARGVSLLATPASMQAASLETLFWNRSVAHVLTLPRGERVHSFHGAALDVSNDGSLSQAGVDVRGPLVVDEYATTVQLRRATAVASVGSYTLWETARAQLELAMVGRYHDGWLAQSGELAVWPSSGGDRLEGRVVFEIAPLPAREKLELEVRRGGGGAARLSLTPGWWTTVSVSVCANGPWSAEFETSAFVYRDERVVSARVGEVAFVRDDAACEAPAAEANPGVPADAFTLSSRLAVMPIETA
ncbi:MAG: hypothetical protein KY396_03985 [Actinobacteria bacterium]|nr:hypothetical protein [Actinomycetota bacterium]